MAGFKDDLEALYLEADRASTLAAFLPSLFEFLKNHQDELKGITAGYRLSPKGGESSAFRLTDGVISEMGPGDAADVTVSGKGENLLAIFRRRLAPEIALLTGRVRVKGDMAALMKLARLL